MATAGGSYVVNGCPSGNEDQKIMCLFFLFYVLIVLWMIIALDFKEIEEGS